MPLSSKERAALRGEAHHLNPLVHVGHQGVTPDLVLALDDALRTRELVKVQLGRNADIEVKEAARKLANETDSEVVQTIGKTATLYRHNPELDRKKGEPWKA